MLVKAEKERLSLYENRFYEVALKPEETSYPLYTDGIKTKQDFIRNIHTEEEQLNLFYMEDGEICGLLCLCVIQEEQYVQMNGLYVWKNKRTAVKELLDYLKENYRGYEVYFGLPKENEWVQELLRRDGFEQIEHSYNDSLLFENYIERPECENIRKIEKDRYEDFRQLHKAVDDTMYWNSDRIFAELKDWNVYVYYEDGKPIADMYEYYGEIFGFEFADQKYDAEIFRQLLVTVLNSLKQRGCRYAYFFNEEQTQEAAVRAGFHCAGEYVCYYKKIK